MSPEPAPLDKSQKIGPAGQTLEEMMPTDIDAETKQDAKGNASFYKLKKETDTFIKDEKWLEGFLDEEPDYKVTPYLWYRWYVGHFMQLQETQIFFLSLVCANGIFIGITTDHDIEGAQVVEMLFLGFFILEIMLKLFAFEWLFWNDGWNTADFLIVMVAIVDVIITETGTVTDSTGVSALRVVRIFRLFRIVGRLERLNLLVQAFIFSLYSVMWVFFLMILMLYICGVIATNAFKPGIMARVKANGVASGDADTWFSTVPMAMATLLQAPWTHTVILALSCCSRCVFSS